MADQQPIQIDSGLVLQHLQDEAKKSEVVRLALDAAVKSAYIDQQNARIAEMEKMIEAFTAEQKKVVPPTKPTKAPSPNDA